MTVQSSGLQTIYHVFFLIPSEFKGNSKDNGLIKIITEYQLLKSK
jgi:hypothetical protein